jgi:hypothetical protein
MLWTEKIFSVLIFPSVLLSVAHHCIHWTMSRSRSLPTIFCYNLQSSAIANLYNLSAADYKLWVSRSAVLHQSSGASFQRRMFSLLGSRAIPTPQPQKLLTYSAFSIYSNCLLLSRSLLSRALPIINSCCPISFAFITPGRTKWKTSYTKENTACWVPLLLRILRTAS